MQRLGTASTMRGMSRARRCATGFALLASLLAPAAASADSYTRCPDVPGASVVDQARTSCAAVASVALAAAAVPAEETAGVLTANGWAPYRALPAGDAAFDIVALKDRQVLRLRRDGEAPDLDGFSAGRELVYARPTIVGGQPIPNDAAFCTSAFLVRLSSGSMGGLSAAHCAGLRSDGTAQRRNVALRRPPEPGVVLGRVQRIVQRTAPLDALLLPAPLTATRTRTAVVDRGISRPPWIVRGVAASTGGRKVCFTGRTSGVDNCGTVRGTSSARVEAFLRREDGLQVRCTTVAAAEGDSGGPVYTKPAADGTVRALGITELIVGLRDQMCFTPIQPVLDRLGAKVVSGV